MPMPLVHGGGWENLHPELLNSFTASRPVGPWAGPVPWGLFISATEVSPQPLLARKAT